MIQFSQHSELPSMSEVGSAARSQVLTRLRAYLEGLEFEISLKPVQEAQSAALRRHLERIAEGIRRIERERSAQRWATWNMLTARQLAELIVYGKE